MASARGRTVRNGTGGNGSDGHRPFRSTATAAFLGARLRRFLPPLEVRDEIRGISAAALELPDLPCSATILSYSLRHCVKCAVYREVACTPVPDCVVLFITADEPDAARGRVSSRHLA